MKKRVILNRRWLLPAIASATLISFFLLMVTTTPNTSLDEEIVEIGGEGAAATGRGGVREMLKRAASGGVSGFGGLHRRVLATVGIRPPTGPEEKVLVVEEEDGEYEYVYEEEYQYPEEHGDAYRERKHFFVPGEESPLDEDEIYEEEHPYDPETEDPVNRCRRDPTWRITANYTECEEITGWKPRDTWWRYDPEFRSEMLHKHENDIHKCIKHEFNYAKADAIKNRHSQSGGKYPWAKCNEDDKDAESCYVPPAGILGSYHSRRAGDLVRFENAINEQELFGLNTLIDCMYAVLPRELPWYETRTFGSKDQYADVGGNTVNYLQGMIQVFLPGVTSSIHRNFRSAYREEDWHRRGYPEPDDLGIRTVELLEYYESGRLGTHTDSDSIFTIAIALSTEDEYEGGYYRLQEEKALFKSPQRGAMVFFAESNHGVTPITKGMRRIFVVELWENDDVPIGFPRPDFSPWEDHMEARTPFLVTEVE